MKTANNGNRYFSFTQTKTKKIDRAPRAWDTTGLTLIGMGRNGADTHWEWDTTGLILIRNV